MVYDLAQVKCRLVLLGRVGAGRSATQILEGYPRQGLIVEVLVLNP